MGTSIHDMLRMLLYAGFGLTFGLSVFGGIALWRFLKYSRAPGSYRWGEDDTVTSAKRTTAADR